jgi:hypothetical protein
MEINYDISREELLAFHIKYSTKTVTYKKFIKLLYEYFFIVGLAGIIDCRSIVTALTSFIGFMLFVFLIKKYLFLFCFKKLLSRKYCLEKYNSYFCNTILIINDEHLNLMNELDNKIYKWKSIIKIYFIDDYILITTKSHDDILIPIAAFESSEEISLFIDNIAKNRNIEIKNSYPPDINYF